MSADDEEYRLDYLISLEEWTTRTIGVAEEIGHERLRVDFIAQLALAKAIEQCGEIGAQILRRWPAFAAEHPETLLRLAVDMPNRIAHGYHSLNLDLIWLTATTSIPEMQAAVRAVISRMSQR